MISKAVISNKSALTAKYGAAGVGAVDAALAALVAADAARGVTTTLYWIDDGAAMTKVKGAPPVNAKDQRGAKAAVDAIVNAVSPDYILLLDGPDVIPHIALDNPLPNDGDSSVDSDLPYASAASFARQPSRYLKITRVVGRVPNLPGANNPARLVALLDFAAKANPRPATDYADYFGLSASVWAQSTSMSLDEAFNGHADLELSPPADVNRVSNRFGRLSHFVNCHGASQSPDFYGQDSQGFPVALNSGIVAANAPGGAVVAAECCYGAQLYDSALLAAADPIAMAYLARGALAYLGSTNIAYGPPDANGQADLLTQYFFENIIAGASSGRALFQARVRFLTSQDLTDPSNLKTLAQFLLLGDPSVTPCAASAQTSSTQKLMARAEPVDSAAQVKSRRVALASAALAIASGKAVCSGPGKASAAAKDKVRAIATSRNYPEQKETLIGVTGGADFKRMAKAKKATESVMVVTTKMPSPAHIQNYKHLIAHIVDDGIAAVREIVSR